MFRTTEQNIAKLSKMFVHWDKVNQQQKKSSVFYLDI